MSLNKNKSYVQRLHLQMKDSILTSFVKWFPGKNQEILQYSFESFLVQVVQQTSARVFSWAPSFLTEKVV